MGFRFFYRFRKRGGFCGDFLLQNPCVSGYRYFYSSFDLGHRRDMAWSRRGGAAGAGGERCVFGRGKEAVSLLLKLVRLKLVICN